MAKRIVIEFICDVCAKIQAIEHYCGNATGNIAKLHPYPKGWKFSKQSGKSVDVCPDCPLPVVEEVANGAR